jgi:hypothetical protein
MFRAFNVFIFRRVFILPRPAGGFWRIGFAKRREVMIAAMS